jgi:hypothetical protein
MFREAKWKYLFDFLEEEEMDRKLKWEPGSLEEEVES